MKTNNEILELGEQAVFIAVTRRLAIRHWSTPIALRGGKLPRARVSMTALSQPDRISSDCHRKEHLLMNSSTVETSTSFVPEFDVVEWTRQACAASQVPLGVEDILTLRKLIVLTRTNARSARD